MTRNAQDIIDDMRNIVKPRIAKMLLEANFEGCGKEDKADFETEFEMLLTLAEKALEQEAKTSWIPVSENLPKPFSYVNCTCRSLIDDRAFWVVETCYVPQPKNSRYSDWGNIPMLNHGECEVVAWMYREIPKPYKGKREDEE